LPLSCVFRTPLPVILRPLACLFTPPCLSFYAPLSVILHPPFAVSKVQENLKIVHLK
jgi:hypothetical protein